MRDDSETTSGANQPWAPDYVETGGTWFLVKIVLDIFSGFPYQQRPLFPVSRWVEYLGQQGTAFIRMTPSQNIVARLSLRLIFARDSTQSFLVEKVLELSVCNDVFQASRFEAKSPPFFGVRS